MKRDSRRGRILAAREAEKRQGGKPSLSKFAKKQGRAAGPDSPFAVLKNHIVGSVPQRPLGGGCMACGAGPNDPCALDKGDGICPEINAPRGTKVQHGNGVTKYDAGGDQ